MLPGLVELQRLQRVAAIRKVKSDGEGEVGYQTKEAIEKIRIELRVATKPKT